MYFEVCRCLFSCVSLSPCIGERERGRKMSMCIPIGKQMGRHPMCTYPGSPGWMCMLVFDVSLSSMFV